MKIFWKLFWLPSDTFWKTAYKLGLTSEKRWAPVAPRLMADGTPFTMSYKQPTFKEYRARKKQDKEFLQSPKREEYIKDMMDFYDVCTHEPTTCCNGHELTPENTYVYPGTSFASALPECLTCHNAEEKVEING